MDLVAGTLHVHQQLQKIDKKLIVVPTPKTDAGNRVLPLPAYLLELLKLHRQQQVMDMLSEK